MPNLSTRIGDALTSHQVELLRVASSKARKLLPFLEDLEASLIKQVRRAGLTRFQKQRLNSLLMSSRGAIAEAYADANLGHSLQTGRLIAAEVKITDTILNEEVGASIFDTVLPTNALEALNKNTLIMGSPAKEWWSRQAGDLQFRFAREMRLGTAAGETTSQLVTRVIGGNGHKGLVMLSRSQAEALVRTSVLEASNEARMAVYRRNSKVIRGVQQLSTLDDRTTEICIAYDKKTWTLDGEPIPPTELPFNDGPPRHWQCRSVLVPLTKSWEDLGAKVRKKTNKVRASLDGEVAADTSFEDWLGRQSTEAQDRILGKGKANLWRSGKISVTDLLDQRGNPLSLSELQKRYLKKSG